MTTRCPVSELRFKSIKKTLRTVAPMIAVQLTGVWGDMVRTTLQNIELGCGTRMSEESFDSMYEYGMDKVRLLALANKWDSAEYAIEQVNNPLLPQEQCAIELRKELE